MNSGLLIGALSFFAGVAATLLVLYISAELWDDDTYYDDDEYWRR